MRIREEYSLSQIIISTVFDKDFENILLAAHLWCRQHGAERWLLSQKGVALK